MEFILRPSYELCRFILISNKDIVYLRMTINSMLYFWIGIMYREMVCTTQIALNQKSHIKWLCTLMTTNDTTLFVN